MEKIAPKLKGITSMSVKEVVTSLVDDSMVDTDKIGTSVYFWAFPSKASANRKRKLDTLSGQISEVRGIKVLGWEKLILWYSPTSDYYFLTVHSISILSSLYTYIFFAFKQYLTFKDVELAKSLKINVQPEKTWHTT